MKKKGLLLQTLFGRKSGIPPLKLSLNRSGILLEHSFYIKKHHLLNAAESAPSKVNRVSYLRLACRKINPSDC